MVKNVILFVAIAVGITFITGILKASWLYSEEVHTSWYFSRGYKDGNTVYFVITYSLMRKPKGIARFPDGGTSKGLFGRVLLYRCDLNGENLKLCGVFEKPQLGGNMTATSAIMERKGNRVYIMYYGNNTIGDKVNRYHIFTWDRRQEVISRITNIEEKKKIVERMIGLYPRYKKESVPIKVNDRYTYDEWGLPSPLSYVDKSTDELFNDLVELKGDTHYRNAILQAHRDILTEAKITELLNRIQKKLDSYKEYDSYERLRYKLSVKDLQEKLGKMQNSARNPNNSN